MEPLVVRDLATLGTLAGRQVYDAIRSRQMPTQAPATAAAPPRAQRAKDELDFSRYKGWTIGDLARTTRITCAG